MTNAVRKDDTLEVSKVQSDSQSYSQDKSASVTDRYSHFPTNLSAIETNSALGTTKRPLFRLASNSKDEKGTEEEEEGAEGGDTGRGVPTKAPMNVNVIGRDRRQDQSILARRDGAFEAVTGSTLTLRVSRDATWR